MNPSRAPLTDEQLLKYAAHAERHPDSPVFALLADRKLQDGRLDEALRIVEAGVSRHPAFVAGLLLQAKIHSRLRRYSDAREALKAAERISPDCAGMLLLKSAVAQLELSHPPEPNIAPAACEPVATELPRSDGKKQRASRRHDLLPDFSLSAAVSPDVEEEGPAKFADAADFAGASELREENELERLARILDTARIPTAPDPAEAYQTTEADPEVNLQQRPATETLAEIYAGQGRIDEAVDMLLTICVHHPERKDRLIKRIAELRRQLDAEHD